MPEDGWGEWRQHVLAEQSRLAQSVEGLGSKMDQKFTTLSQELADFKLDVTRDVTALKTKASLFGGVAGAIVGLVAWLAGGR